MLSLGTHAQKGDISRYLLIILTEVITENSNALFSTCALSMIALIQMYVVDSWTRLGFN
jgi:hypothetical protein